MTNTHVDNIKKHYPLDEFSLVYPAEGYKDFISAGAKLLEQGYGVSEVHDILEDSLLTKYSLR